MIVYLVPVEALVMGFVCLKFARKLLNNCLVDFVDISICGTYNSSLTKPVMPRVILAFKSLSNNAGEAWKYLLDKIFSVCSFWEEFGGNSNLCLCCWLIRWLLYTWQLKMENAFCYRLLFPNWNGICSIFWQLYQYVVGKSTQPQGYCYCLLLFSTSGILY